MKTRTTTNDFPLTVEDIRKLKKQLVSASVKTTNSGMFFMVTTKSKVRKVLKTLGFSRAEIKEIMRKVTKI